MADRAPTPHSRATEALVRVVTGTLVSLRRSMEILRNDPAMGAKLVLEHASVLSRGVAQLAPQIDDLAPPVPVAKEAYIDLHKVLGALGKAKAIEIGERCRRCGRLREARADAVGTEYGCQAP